MLARCYAEHFELLVADFQQYYNLDVCRLIEELDRGAGEVQERRVAALCAELPRDSRTMRLFNPSFEWSDETYLLSRCEFFLRCIQWMLSEDGANGDNKPKPLETPAQIGATTRQVEETDFDFINAHLSGVLGDSVTDVGKGVT